MFLFLLFLLLLSFFSFSFRRRDYYEIYFYYCMSEFTEQYGLYNHLLPPYSQCQASYQSKTRIVQYVFRIAPRQVLYGSVCIDFWLSLSIKESLLMSTVRGLTLPDRAHWLASLLTVVMFASIALFTVLPEGYDQISCSQLLAEWIR